MQKWSRIDVSGQADLMASAELMANGEIDQNKKEVVVFLRLKPFPPS